MNRSAIKGTLRALSLFAVLPDPELELLAASVRSARYRKGARLFEEGSVADCCYVLTAGRAKVVLNLDDGGEARLNEVAPGDLVGEVALLGGFPRSAALVALEPCHAIVIPERAFDLLRRNPSFERTVVKHVAETLRESTQHVLRVSSGSSLARVARCLNAIATREGTRDGTMVIIKKTPHHELADMAGCARETVSRALSALKRKQCLSWDASTMRLDVDRLRRFSGEPG